MRAAPAYEVRENDRLGRYLVAARDLRCGETVLTDNVFVLGPNGDSSLVCFNCFLPLISKFVCCKTCGITPVCPGDGCPRELVKWHDEEECSLFIKCKEKGLNAMKMVQNVNGLGVLRAVLKKQRDPQGWRDFMQLEAHLDQRRNTNVWKCNENIVKFIESLGLLDEDEKDVVQKVCGVIDVNSFEVRGPAIPALGCSETLRGVFPRASLLAHDCTANTHISINDNNAMIVSACVDIEKGAPIVYNYTDSLQGTALRRKHLIIGKYFECTCERCSDPTEMGTYMSSLMCSDCKTGYVSKEDNNWSCNNCKHIFDSATILDKIKNCSDKLATINKKDEKQLEEYIKNVSLVLAPNHYLLIDAKQRLAGVLRDVINREPRPVKKMMKRKIELCEELLPVLEKVNPGICRIKAITLYELHATMVQFAKKMFDAREITASAYMDKLVDADKILKRALEMLIIEPGNSPEGQLCAKALEEYRALKLNMSRVLDGIRAEGKTYVGAARKQESLQPSVN